MEAFGVKCLASQGASDVKKESSCTAIDIIDVSAKVVREVKMQRLSVVTFKAKVSVTLYQPRTEALRQGLLQQVGLLCEYVGDEITADKLT